MDNKNIQLTNTTIMQMSNENVVMADQLSQGFGEANITA